MKVSVMIPTPLRAYTDQKSSVDVDADSVDRAVDVLVEKHPKLKAHLLDDQGELRNFVNLYLNDEDIRYLEEDKKKLKDGDTISIVPSIAGGA